MNTNIRYLIKVTAIATDDNPNFKGATYTYYYGCNQHLLGATSVGIEPPEYMELTRYFVEQYGYKTRNTSKAIKFWTSLSITILPSLTILVFGPTLLRLLLMIWLATPLYKKTTASLF